MVAKRLTKQISLGIDPQTGRRIRKRIYADTPAKLRQAEKQAQDEFRRKGNPSSVTFRTYSERYREIYISVLAINTQNGFRTVLNKCASINEKRMQDITRTDLQAILQANWQYPYQCKRIAVTLAAIWRAAYVDGIVATNIAIGLKRPKIVKKEKRAFTPEENEAIRTAPFTPLERLMVNILYQFGLRAGEAFALSRSDIAPDGLHITKSLTHDGERPVIKSTKTTMTRVLPIPPTVLPKIQPVLDTEYLFTNPDGSLFTKKQAYVFAQAIIKKIQHITGASEDVTLYSFRHNKASLLYYTAGVSIKAKSAYLGHSEEVYIKTYSHAMQEKEDINALNEAII